MLRLQADFRRIIILIRIFYGKLFFTDVFLCTGNSAPFALKVATENGDVERGYSPLGFYERVCLVFFADNAGKFLF